MQKRKRILLYFILLFSVGIFAQEVGNATFYHSKFKGHRTTDGSKYHPDSMTCAHKTYPLGTYLMVVNPENNRRVVVKVTDRGPFNRHLMIDLSYAAAQKIDIVRKGIAKVQVYYMDEPPTPLLYIPCKLWPITINKIYPDSLFLLR